MATYLRPDPQTESRSGERRGSHWIAVYSNVGAGGELEPTVYGPAPGPPICYQHEESGDRFTFLQEGKLVTMSGNPGDGSDSSAVNFTWYPWPDDSMALLDRQWAAAIPLWQDLGAFALAHGVDRLAFELHPLHLVYNVPTLRRMREAVGPVIGANVDPSHLFWQGMDPLAVIRALGPAVHHVHLKDTELVAYQMALAGVLDQRPFEDPVNRAWVFRTVGAVHGPEFWSAFIAALESVGYDDVLSIENEDAGLTPQEGVEQAAAFMLPLLAHRPVRA